MASVNPISDKDRSGRIPDKDRPGRIPDKDRPGQKAFTIRIDRTEYKWSDEKINGAQLRHLPPTPIPPERDLFQVIPGHPDRKIKNDDTVEVRDGLRFFTAPNTINPGTNCMGLGTAK